MSTKVSPKLVELSKQKFIAKVNEMLDNDESPNQVCAYINKQGFKISVPMIYEYAKIRKKAMVNGLTMQELVTNVTANRDAESALTTLSDEPTKQYKSHLRNELDALDMIIQNGFETLKKLGDNIPPRLLMDAIRLKNELTDGNHMFLTPYGIQQLKEIEANKYQLLMEHLIEYIPEDKREQAISELAILEDEYYQKTPYYEEFLRSNKKLTEAEIQARLREVREKMTALDVVASFV